MRPGVVSSFAPVALVSAPPATAPQPPEEEKHQETQTSPLTTMDQAHRGKCQVTAKGYALAGGPAHRIASAGLRGSGEKRRHGEVTGRLPACAADPLIRWTLDLRRPRGGPGPPRAHAGRLTLRCVVLSCSYADFAARMSSALPKCSCSVRGEPASMPHSSNALISASICGGVKENRYSGCLALRRGGLRRLTVREA